MKDACASLSIATAENLSSLRRRHLLRLRWALLFSHPDDFASYGFESDRWLCQVEAAFDACEIRPGSMRLDDSQRRPMENWITQLGGATDIGLPVATNALRLVVVVDDSLRVRRTFAYRSDDALPSLIDLAEFAASIRDRHVADRRENTRLRLAATATAIMFSTLAATAVARTRRRNVAALTVSQSRCSN